MIITVNFIDLYLGCENYQALNGKLLQLQCSDFPDGQEMAFVNQGKDKSSILVIGFVKNDKIKPWTNCHRLRLTSLHVDGQWSQTLVKHGPRLSQHVQILMNWKVPLMTRLSPSQVLQDLNSWIWWRTQVWKTCMSMYVWSMCSKVSFDTPQ